MPQSVIVNVTVTVGNIRMVRTCHNTCYNCACQVFRAKAFPYKSTIVCVWGDGGHVTGEVIGPLIPKAPGSNLILKNSRVVIKKELKLRQ